jgi:hypothetical protein
LYAEQGFGDSIQFVRYVPLVAAKGASVILRCPRELRGVFETVPNVERVITAEESIPSFELHCPLGSLPLAFGTTIESIPAAVPYITATARTDLEPGFKVGIAWSGRPTHPNDLNRSIPIRLFEPISKTEGVALHSLQKESPPGEISFRVIDHSSELTDFAQTAKLIAAIDLVISVDTAVAHLAGAMGKEVWLLVPFAPDWRWMLGREDSPWYPTMRIFRQASPGDWEGVIRRVPDELIARASGDQPPP